MSPTGIDPSVSKITPWVTQKVYNFRLIENLQKLWYFNRQNFKVLFWETQMILMHNDP